MSQYNILIIFKTFPNILNNLFFNFCLNELFVVHKNK